MENSQPPLQHLPMGHHATRHDDNGLKLRTVSQPQLNALYKSCHGHSVSPIATETLRQDESQISKGMNKKLQKQVQNPNPANLAPISITYSNHSFL